MACVPLLLQSGLLPPAITLSSVPSIMVPLLGSTQRQIESSRALADLPPLPGPLKEARDRALRGVATGVSVVVSPVSGRHWSGLNLPSRSHSILESFCCILTHRPTHREGTSSRHYVMGQHRETINLCCADKIEPARDLRINLIKLNQLYNKPLRGH